MIKTYRLRNLLMSEQITGPELETLLQKKDYLGALYDLRNDKVWLADIYQHPGAMAVILASETALAAITASKTALAAITASETAMAAVTASETAMATITASETAMAAVWGSALAIHTLNSSEKAKNFFLSKSTTVKTYKDQPNLPKGKILVTKIRFEVGGNDVELITRAGGSINDIPIKNNVTTDQIVIQAIIDCNSKIVSNNPWVNISYIQVAQ